MLNSNKIYLDRIKSILKYEHTDLYENTSIYNQKALEGDYVSFYSNPRESIVVSRIIGNGDNIFYIIYEKYCTVVNIMI